MIFLFGFRKSKKTAFYVYGDTFFAVEGEKRGNGFAVKSFASGNYHSNDLEGYIDGNGLRGSEAVIVLGGDMVISRIINLPVMPEDEMRQALEWEVTKYIPLPPEEISFDYNVFTEDAGGRSDILLVAVKNEALDPVCERLYNLNLRLRQVNVEGMALGQLFNHITEDAEEGSIVCNACYQDDHCILAYQNKGNLFYVHSFRWENDKNSQFIIEVDRVNSYVSRQFSASMDIKVNLAGFPEARYLAEAFSREYGTDVSIVSLNERQNIIIDRDIDSFDHKFYIPLGGLIGGE